MQYQNGQILGAVDLGESSESVDVDYQEEATDALVFMVNCINSNLRLPLGKKEFIENILISICII